MKQSRETGAPTPASEVAQAWEQVSASFERFCLTAGLSVLGAMMEQDATELCGPHYGHRDGKPGHRWGKTQGKIGFHGGKISLDRPRVRGRDGQDMLLPSRNTVHFVILMAATKSIRAVGSGVRGLSG